MNRSMVFFGAASLAVVGAFLFAGQEGGGRVEAPAFVSEASAQDATPVDVSALEAKGYALGDIVLGDPEAPVTILEYARLTCPACRSFHEGAFKDIKEKYVDTGKAKFVVREVFADARGVIAASIARCAGPDRYHDFLDVFFTRQDEWMNVTSIEELKAKVAPIGRLGGLSSERLTECMEDEAYLTHLYRTSTVQADADNVRRTPTIFINGDEFEGAYYDVEALSAAIDAHL